MNQLFNKLRNGLFLLALLTALDSSAGSYVNFEGKQTSPVRVSADGTRLFAVNTPDARLSVFDISQPTNPRLIAEIPVGVEPVSVNPRNNDEVWVVNEVSDSVSVVSVSRRMVIDTLYVKDEPADVVFAGGKAFISAARKNQLAVFDAVTRTSLTNLALFGENPRAMAVSADGSKVYVAFALSGNHTTLVPAANAPAQITNAPAMNPALSTPPQVSLIVDATNATYYPSVIKYNLPDNDIAEIDVANPSVTRYLSRVGTVNLGLAIQPGTGDLFVANTEARNLVHFEPVVRSHVVDNRVTRVSLASGVVTPIDLNPGVDYAILPNLPALTNALAQPTSLVFDPSGDFLYVAAFGSDRVAKLRPDGTILARIEIGPAVGSTADPRHKRGPRGLTLLAPANRLYVLNRLANSLSIIDTTANAVLKEIPIGSYDPTPAVVRNGRGFLYDAKLSGNGTMACAACHVDAEMDLIAWDLGDPTGQMAGNLTTFPLPNTGTFFSIGSSFHPMKGPMTTQTFRGLSGADPLHWRGDRTNFTHFNVAFPGLMGTTALAANDMAAYRDFVNTLVFQPNPNQNLDRTYPTNFAGGNAAAGQNAFFFTNYTSGLKCTTCHTGPPGVGSDRLIIFQQALQESQDFKVPHLRNIYQKLNFNTTPGANSIGGFGLTHDGVDPTLQTFFSRPVFANIRNDTTIKNNLAAFVQCFDTGTAPAVGYTRTINAGNLSSTSISNDWSLLESQAALTNVDLVVHGTFNGQLRGLVYRPKALNYQPDSTNLPAVTRAQLAALIQTGDVLTVMGVPPGSGTRMGIDRDEDGVLDGDVPPPRLQIAQQPGGLLLNWPYGATGYQLEASPGLSSLIWTNVTSPLEILGGQNVLTNPTGPSAQFFRLRFN